jgi:hypothetical protein
MTSRPTNEITNRFGDDTEVLMDRRIGQPAGGPPVDPGQHWLLPLQLTIEQAAIVTSFSVRTLKRLVAMEAIPGVTRVFRCLRFNRRALEQWIEQGCPKPAGHRGRHGGSTHTPPPRGRGGPAQK